MTDRYAAADLIRFASALLQHAGIEASKADVVADILVEGDLMGHTTHGLALLAQNLDEAEAGRMTGTGQPEIVSSTPVVDCWNGRRLPGPWLVREALDLCAGRAETFGLAAVAISRATHIGCLAAYLPHYVAQGKFVQIVSSDPSVASVAPFGGRRALYTPNPMAAGWPTPTGPVLLDVSMSITTNGMIGRLRAQGRPFEQPWLLDSEGRPSTDPNAFFADPPGSVLPLGGVEYGHKGFALGIMLEAMTSALAGYGRADGETRWGANVFVLVIDPARFGGSDAFLRETGWMADAVHANPPRTAGETVRLPGERAIQRRAQQLAEGVELHPSIPPALAARGAVAGLTPPRPL
jgi:LDH2 family malate/lactate/ureidoglycolate dehydrogenase